MRFLRSLSGVTIRDRIKSEKIRKQWKVEESIEDIQNYQQKWNQHVLRIPENRLPRKSLQYQPQRKRELGRPYMSLERHKDKGLKRNYLPISKVFIACCI